MDLLNILESLKKGDTQKIKEFLNEMENSDCDQIVEKLLFLCYARLCGLNAANEAKYLNMLCYHLGFSIGDLIKDLKEATTGKRLAEIFIEFIHYRNVSELKDSRNGSFLESNLD